MELRKINLQDVEAQWEYTTNLPEDENGLTNSYRGKGYGTEGLFLYMYQR